MEVVDILLRLLEEYVYLVPLAVMILFFIGTRGQIEIPRVGGSPQRLRLSRTTHRWLDHGLEMLEDGYRRVSESRTSIKLSHYQDHN